MKRSPLRSSGSYSTLILGSGTVRTHHAVHAGGRCLACHGLQEPCRGAWRTPIRTQRAALPRGMLFGQAWPARLQRLFSASRHIIFSFFANEIVGANREQRLRPAGALVFDHVVCSTGTGWTVSGRMQCRCSTESVVLAIPLLHHFA